MKRRSEMRKYQEAFKRLQIYNLAEETECDLLLPDYSYDDIINDLRTIGELVDKETPMKLKSNGENCGNCDGLVYRKYEKQCEHYCDNCGQRIDWTDVIKMEEEERK